MELVSSHYNFFKKNISHDQHWAGYNIRNYVLGIDIDYFGKNSKHYPDKRLTRQDLFNLINDDKTPTEVCLNSILIWGGIRRDHFRLIFESKKIWISACEKIRKNQINREICYDIFSNVRDEGYRGIGPAYFTKLIYFLNNRSEENGYIMDQWTARSVNLLTGKRIVNLTRSGNSYYVNNYNDSKIYNDFCSIIDFLAKNIGVEPDLIELNLFSNGGHQRGNWRNYVIQNHRE